MPTAGNRRQSRAAALPALPLETGTRGLGRVAPSATEGRSHGNAVEPDLEAGSRSGARNVLVAAFAAGDTGRGRDIEGKEGARILSRAALRPARETILDLSFELGA